MGYFPPSSSRTRQLRHRPTRVHRQAYCLVIFQPLSQHVVQPSRSLICASPSTCPDLSAMIAPGLIVLGVAPHPRYFHRSYPYSSLPNLIVETVLSRKTHAALTLPLLRISRRS